MTSKWYGSRVNFLLSKTYRGRIHDTTNCPINSHQASVRNLNNNNIVSCNFQPKDSKLLFFRILPPVKSYLNILEALRTLNNLNNSDRDKDGYEFKYSSLKKNDVGFSELAKVLKEELFLSGEIGELRIVEEEAGITIGDSPKMVRELILINNGVKDTIIFSPFDPKMPIKELKEMAEKALKSELAKGLVVLFLLWVFLTLITELPAIKLW